MPKTSIIGKDNRHIYSTKADFKYESFAHQVNKVSIGLYLMEGIENDNVYKYRMSNEERMLQIECRR